MTKRNFDSNFKQQIHIRILAAGDARGLRFVVPQKREQGMPDARFTRGLVCKRQNENRTRAYRAAEAIRHSLRNGFTAYFALPGVSGFLASVASRKLALWPGWAFAPPLRLDANH